jgi:NAD+ synthase (glutamine-hydrolysing)
MKIGGAALNQTPLDWDNNLQNILEAISMARSQDVDILSLPELVITGYGCEDMFLHPWVANKALKQLEIIVAASRGIAVTIGLPLWYDDKLYNVVCLIHDQNILGFQAKQNLAKTGVHYEPRWFEPWPAGELTTIEVAGGQYPLGDNIYTIEEAVIGFEICEDAWVDNRPACRLVEKKVNLILNSSASHFAIEKIAERVKLFTDSSREFNCTYVFTNQLGNEAGRIIYDGDVIIAKQGRLLTNAQTLTMNDIQFAATKVDLGQGSKVEDEVGSIFEPGSPFQEFTNAVTLGLHDYLRKSKSKGFVISLSGGADSSACLVLVTEMIKTGITTYGIAQFLNRIGRAELIGKVLNAKDAVHELVHCAYQGSKNSSPETLDSARTLAESVGATFYHWQIDEEVDNAHRIIEEVIGRQLTWEEDDIALQNIQARSRSPLIWMVANIQKALLITTSNRSEGSVGYATMDGDTSGSLAPLAGIDKPFIIKWLEWVFTEKQYAGLVKVLALAPSAELRPRTNRQTDEQDLMPYTTLTKIEELFAYERKSPLQIYHQLKLQDPDIELAGQITLFFKLWTRNQWKRERLAPSFQLAKFNIDSRSWFRFPILSGGFVEELEEINSLTA